MIGTGFVEYVKIDDNIYEDSLLDITNGNSYAKLWRTKVYNFQGTGLAKYTFSKLPEAHRLTAMVGGEIQQCTTRSRFTEGGNLDGHIYEDPKFTKPEPDGWLVRNPATESIWTFMSAFTRIKYVYQDKLIVSGSFRTDGSSKFGPDNRYGFFPSAGVGYIMSEEQFLADNDAINFLKLKASWGITGNADIPWKKQFGLFGEPAPDSYNGDTSIFPLQLAKPDLSWETTTTFDAGFEIGFLNDRITTEFAFYNKLSKDVLIDTRIQASTGIFDDGGAHNFLKNIGEIRNRGVEFSITTRNLVGKFKWKTTLNIGHNKNKVLDLGITAPDAIAGPGDTRVIVGHAVGVNYLVRFSHVDSETGLPVYLDKDGNETFEFNEDNRVIVGNVHPDFTGGITNTFEFKNFDLSFLWTFSYGGNIYDDAAKRQLGVFSDWNMRVEIMDRWTQPGDDATYPKLTLDPGTYGLASEWANNTDLWLYDASYLRLKTLTLGYDVPIKDGKSKGFRKARVYVMGTNLVTFTEYPGWDPEIVRDHNGPQGRNVAPNVTYLTPPQERTISFGVDLQF